MGVGSVHHYQTTHGRCSYCMDLVSVEALQQMELDSQRDLREG